MSILRSIASYIFNRLPRCGSQANILSHKVEKSPSLQSYSFSTNKGMHSSTGEQGAHSNLHANLENNVQPAAPKPPNPGFPLWARWVLGSILSLSLSLPFMKKKLMKLQKIERKVENVEEVIETAAEAVEEVAKVVEKVSTEVAEKLPDDGKIKDAALLVGRVSNEFAKDAQTTIDFIHKVDELKQEVETLAEAIIGHRSKFEKTDHGK
ncbi:uncharacterized protein LOC143858306 [Tasmannia lanceolata]|uniref:uncharacterized protein LOC143858306 n=1 Tax=Tasmannia lanceolata TaxID=3420 RepID=UPI0040628F97